MKIGGIEFVTYAALSDAYENVYTLLRHTYEYNGNNNSTMTVQYGRGEEFDLSESDLEEMAAKLNRNPEEKIVAETLFRDICEKYGLMLVSYEEMERLEQLYLPVALFDLFYGKTLGIIIGEEKWELRCTGNGFLTKIVNMPPGNAITASPMPYPYNAFELSKEELKKEIYDWIWENRKEILRQHPFYW